MNLNTNIIIFHCRLLTIMAAVCEGNCSITMAKTVVSQAAPPMALIPLRRKEKITKDVLSGSMLQKLK